MRLLLSHHHRYLPPRPLIALLNLYCFILAISVFFISKAPVGIVFATSLSDHRAVLLLSDANFNAAVSDNSYIPVLFCNKNTKDSSLRNNFDIAARKVFTSGKYCETCDLAMVITDDESSKQIMQQLSVKVPSIKVFRSGGMYDYHGPFDDPSSMGEFLIEDSKPSVTVLSEYKEFKTLFSDVTQSGMDGSKVVVGYFNNLKETVAETLPLEGDSLSFPPSTSSLSKAPWIHFMEAAESLRRRANFFAFSNPAIMKKIKKGLQKPPFIFMVQENGDLLEYTEKNDFSEAALTSWILYNSDLGLIDLSGYDMNNDIYVSKFVSDPSLKFTLFLDYFAADGDGGRSVNNLITQWDFIRSQMAPAIVMSYSLGKSDPDVFSFYRIPEIRLLKFPFIAAFNPKNNIVYKSEILTPQCSSRQQESDHVASTEEGFVVDCQDFSASMTKFITDVANGVAPRAIRTQEKPIFKKGKKIIPVVGSTLLDAISIPKVDIFLLLYLPYNQKHRNARSTFELLGKSLIDEKRIMLLQMNAHANEYPEEWKIKTFPILLWFDAAENKTDAGAIRMPFMYNGPSLSLFDMIHFIRKMSSFDPSTLKVIDSTQLNKLAETEGSVVDLINYDEHFELRNEGREPLENDVNEYLFGEVVYDGKRWHVYTVLFFLFVWLVSINRLINLHFYTKDLEKQISEEEERKKIN